MAERGFADPKVGGSSPPTPFSAAPADGVLPSHFVTLPSHRLCRDEGLHTEFACALYALLDNDNEKPKQETIHAVVREAVDIERDFVTSALPVRLIGMNAELMGRYVEFVADRLLLSLGCAKLYGTPNPFDFMEQLSLQGKTNFFGGWQLRLGALRRARWARPLQECFRFCLAEKRVGDYQKAGVAVMTTESKMPREIAFDADF